MEKRTDIYQVEGNLVYKLMDTHEYRNGNPILTNQFSITVQGAPSEGETFPAHAMKCNLLAEKIRDLLNHDLNVQQGIAIKKIKDQMISDLNQRFEGNQHE